LRESFPIEGLFLLGTQDFCVSARASRGSKQASEFFPGCITLSECLNFIRESFRVDAIDNRKNLVIGNRLPGALIINKLVGANASGGLLSCVIFRDIAVKQANGVCIVETCVQLGVYIACFRSNINTIEFYLRRLMVDVGHGNVKLVALH
jgi:hypothetical protein